MSDGELHFNKEDSSYLLGVPDEHNCIMKMKLTLVVGLNLHLLNPSKSQPEVTSNWCITFDLLPGMPKARSPKFQIDKTNKSEESTQINFGSRGVPVLELTLKANRSKLKEYLAQNYLVLQLVRIPSRGKKKIMGKRLVSLQNFHRPRPKTEYNFEFFRYDKPGVPIVSKSGLKPEIVVAFEVSNETTRQMSQNMTTNSSCSKQISPKEKPRGNVSHFDHSFDIFGDLDEATLNAIENPDPKFQEGPVTPLNNSFDMFADIDEAILNVIENPEPNVQQGPQTPKNKDEVNKLIGKIVPTPRSAAKELSSKIPPTNEETVVAGPSENGKPGTSKREEVMEGQVGELLTPKSETNKSNSEIEKMSATTQTPLWDLVSPEDEDEENLVELFNEILTLSSAQITNVSLILVRDSVQRAKIKFAESEIERLMDLRMTLLMGGHNQQELIIRTLEEQIEIYTQMICEHN